MAAEFQEFLTQKSRLKRLRDAGEHLPCETEDSAGGDEQWEEEEKIESSEGVEKHGPYNRPSALPDFGTYEVNIPHDVLDSLSTRAPSSVPTRLGSKAIGSGSRGARRVLGWKSSAGTRTASRVLGRGSFHVHPVNPVVGSRWRTAKISRRCTMSSTTTEPPRTSLC